MKIASICNSVPVIPVLEISDLSIAEPLAAALVAGGLPVIEVTLRTPEAPKAIELMSGVSGAIVGAGTILKPADIEISQRAGAQFGVSPGTTKTLLKEINTANFPFLPGSATASEVMRLLDHGFDCLKFFPAEAAGGAKMLKSFSSPMPKAKFCPTGGIGEANYKQYLQLPNVMCVGGSWVISAEAIQHRQWQRITDLCLQITDSVKG